jgi:predicted nucleotidyltransferase
MPSRACLLAHKLIWHKCFVEAGKPMEQSHHYSTSLSGEFLSQLIRELDDDTVIAIILHGSYARGDATPPYSDLDLVRILRETPDRKQQKRFIWRNDYLLNLSSRPLSIYKEWLKIPQEAIFRVSTIRDADILLEKDGDFRAFQQETLNWKWEPLQKAADAYVSQLMVELTEVVLRTLGALRFHKTAMLVERIILHILPAVTEAVAVQKGILIHGNNYLRQVQEVMGLDSAWTRYFLEAAGETHDKEAFKGIERRGVAAVRLYQETVQVLKAHFSPEHLKTIEKLLAMADHMLDKEIP